MKEIEHIWENTSIKTEVKPNAKHEKSRFELVKILRILYIEIIVAISIALFFIWFQKTMPFKLLVLSLVTTGISIGLNVHTLVSLKRIDVSDNTNEFLKKSIKFLVAYCYHVVTATFLVLVVFYPFLMESNQYGDKYFLFSYFVLAISILAIVMIYVMLVYVKRIQKLKKMVLKMD